MGEPQAPCPTCGVPVRAYIDEEIKVKDLFESSKRGCVVCAMIVEALSHLVLKDLDEATYKDASLAIEWRFGYQSFCIRADWFQKPNLYIIWKSGVFFSLLHEIRWEPARLRERFLDDSLSQAQRWIETCVSEHNKCNIDYESYLPRRVIQIALDGSTIRLIEGLGKRARYAALSHCWGTSKHLLSTSDNIDQHKLDIPFYSLPKTFRDAVTVCQQWKIEYLWIDSLCIIQDDREDWEQEAANMGSIYEKAFLTLAASAAIDDNEGFWFDSPLLEWKGETPMGGSADASSSHQFDHDGGGSPEFPLSTRGWVFQESILSRRTLKFGQRELLWECKEAKTCECEQRDGYVRTGPKEIGIDFQIGKADFGADDIWPGLVSRYSALKLSVPSDKLPAISAVAKEVATHRKGRYLAGLWEDDLPLDLLWYVASPRQRPQKWRAPSWSWASIDSAVSFKGKNIQNQAFECRVLDAECRPSGLNEYGEVASGHLLIEGKLVKTKFQELPPPNTSPAGDYFIKDYELGIGPEEDVFCMRMVRYPDLWYNNYSLVLRCVDVEKRKFERIGIIFSAYVGAYQTAYPWWWGEDEGERKPELSEVMLL